MLASSSGEAGAALEVIFCLYYRTWGWRFEDFMVGTLNEVQTGTVARPHDDYLANLLSITMMMNIRPSRAT